jgi:hypothetical protein
VAGAESDRISPLISRPTSGTKSRSVQKSPLRKVAESDRTQSDCETIGILEYEDDSSNSEFRLNRPSAIRLVSEGGEAKAGAFAYAPCESSGGAPNAAIPASDLVHQCNPALN